MHTPIRIELPTFFGMKTVNCFLFKEPVPALVDCGEGTESCYQLIKNGATHFMETAKNMYPRNLHLPAVNMVVGYLDLLEAGNGVFYGAENEAGVPIFAK